MEIQAHRSESPTDTLLRTERLAQKSWAATPLPRRLAVLKRLRHLLAARTTQLVDALPPDLSRTRADTLAAEVLPLLAACVFLEREATHILAPRPLGKRGRPLWLAGVHATIERVPFGTVLIIAPSNYPLFLAGSQALQALAAGNAVVWKPGRGGREIASLFAEACEQAGLPKGILRITDESIETAEREIKAHPDKIVFTGSAVAGRAIQRLAADLSISVTAELSGCDAVFVLPSAHAEQVIDALCFGMRLNGSATCMAPRRLILIGTGHDSLLSTLQQRFSAMETVFISEPIHRQLKSLLADAVNLGARVHGQLDDLSMKPILVHNGLPQMSIAHDDLFAPVLTVFHAAHQTAALALESQSPYGLTASIFGNESEARALATNLTVGTVLINDLIVPTADPRVPFGGRKASGFGTTRGAEGLLEMTAAKTVSTRHGKSRVHLQPTTQAHEVFFASFIALTHGSGLWKRLSALRKLITAARSLK